ncbi:MAG TPA: hypothetical protein VK846_16270 [Candidatus Limnocylindria bacterium]|nr:hypothetical protein [Candidatus Limnocylindria bacterium]
MSLQSPEQKARQQIDAQLVASGWVVQDFKNVDFSAGRGIALREVPLKTGPCDYLLLVDRKSLGVIEAKKEGTTLSTIADQSARYTSTNSKFRRCCGSTHSLSPRTARTAASARSRRIGNGSSSGTRRARE